MGIKKVFCRYLNKVVIKKALCERALKQPTFSMTSSKDSQFLEVCKKPILTPLRSLIKT